MDKIGLIISGRLFLKNKFLQEQGFSPNTIKGWKSTRNPEKGNEFIYPYDEIPVISRQKLPSQDALLVLLSAKEQTTKQNTHELAVASLPEKWMAFYIGTDEKYYQDNYNINYDLSKGNRAYQMAVGMAILRFIHANRVKSDRVFQVGLEKMEDFLQGIVLHLKKLNLYGMPTSYDRLRSTYYKYVKALCDQTDPRDLLVSGKYGNKNREVFDEVHLAVLKEVYLKSKKPDIFNAWTLYSKVMEQEYSLTPVKYSRFKQKCSDKEIQVLAARCREGSSYYETTVRWFHLRKRPDYAFSLISGDGWEPGHSVKYSVYDEKSKRMVNKVGTMNVWYWMDLRTKAILAYRIAPAENSYQIRQSFRDILSLHDGWCPMSVMLDKKWEEQKDIKRMFEKAGVVIQPKRGYNPKSNPIERNNKEANKIHRDLDEMWVNMTPGVSRQNRHNDEALRGAKPMEYAEFYQMVKTIFNTLNNTASEFLNGRTPMEAVLERNYHENCKQYDLSQRLWMFGDQRIEQVRNYKITIQIATKKYTFVIPEGDIRTYISRKCKIR